MITKILNSLRSYLALLNMNPESFTFRKKVFIDSEPLQHKRLWVNILLFAVTIVTTTLAGANSYSNIEEIILSGLPFSMTLMAILLSHEMGHYLTARHYGIKATLPYFIPFPSIIGTMGAVIKLKSPIKDRRELLYIGAMGPITGFCLSLIASVAGIYVSEVKPLPADPGLAVIFGDSILTSLITRVIHGRIPAGYDIYLSPYAWAGWIGFLVTSLNLMPLGQLDGSRVIYALIGRKQLILGWATFAGLVILSFTWPGWIVWIIMTLIFLRIGHPPVDDSNGFTTGEKAMGWACILIFILTFMPLPVHL